MKICIDPGHGMSNRTAGVFDSGATHTENGVEFREADIALKYGLTFRDVLLGRGIAIFLTRDDNTDPAPVARRASTAESQGCDVFVSFHLNDYDDDAANGLEVLYNDDADRSLAGNIQQELVRVTNLRHRGVKKRPDLAVLKFNGPAVLIELGFIANDGDRATLLDPEVRNDVCNAIADVLIDRQPAIVTQLTSVAGPAGLSNGYKIPAYALAEVGPQSGVPWANAQAIPGMNIYGGLVKDSCHVFNGTVPAVYYAAKFAIDGDGAGGNMEDDPVYQADTSLHDAHGNPLNSRRYPFIVLPLPPKESHIAKLEDYNVQLGDLGVVIYKNGTVVPVLYGDKGPRRKIGEGSMRAASLLGINPDPNIGGIDAGEIPPGIVHVVFPGSTDISKGRTQRDATAVVNDALALFNRFRGRA